MTFSKLSKIRLSFLSLCDSECDHKSDCYNFNGIVLDLKEKVEECKNPSYPYVAKVLAKVLNHPAILIIGWMRAAGGFESSV